MCLHSSCLIVKDITQTIFRCAEPTKKTNSANINTVAHRQKTELFLGLFYNLFRARVQNFHKHPCDNEVKRVLVLRHYGARVVMSQNTRQYHIAWQIYISYLANLRLPPRRHNDQFYCKWH